MTLFAKLSSSKKQLKTIVETMEKKGIEHIDFDFVINDQIKEFENPKGTIQQNVSVWVSQNKEDQEIKKPKFFVANGRANYTDGKITIITKDGVKTGNIVYDETFSTPDEFGSPAKSKKADTSGGDGLPF